MSDDIPSGGSLGAALRAVTRALTPLAKATAQDPLPSGLVDLLAAAGIARDALDAAGDALLVVCGALAAPLTVTQAHLQVADTPVAELETGIHGVVAALQALDEALPPQGETVSQQLLAHLLTADLHTQHPLLHSVLRVAGLMVEPESGRTGPPARLVPRRLPVLVEDANALLAGCHGWGGTVDYPLLLDRLQRLFLLLGFPSVPHDPDLSVLEALGLDPATVPSRALRVSIAEVTTSGSRADVGMLIVPVRRSGHPDGVAVVPVGHSGVSETVRLDDHWALQIDAASDSVVPNAVTLTPQDVTFSTLERPSRALRARLRVSIVRDRPSGESRIVITLPNGTRLEVGTLRLAAFASSEPADAGFELYGEDWRLVIAVDSDQGLLTRLMPHDGLRVLFDGGIAWSRTKGLHFVAEAGLRADIPVILDQGSVQVTSVHLAVDASTNGGLVAQVSSSVSARLGPFRVGVDGVGLHADLLEPAPTNNVAGLGDLQLGMRAPSGLHLSIQTPTATGAGALSRNEETGDYVGAFQLILLGIVSVQVVGIVSTRPRGGSSDFALLLLITAEGFTPIQLGLGFTLTGIGGLIALNRTMDAETVRNRLSQGVVDSLLFTDDPVQALPALLATLDSVFPRADDRALIGPLAEIGWGSPQILRIRMALLVELPEPVRVVILAALSVVLPDEEHPVVSLRVDAVGVLDIERGELALDASLHDSWLWKWSLTGDLALRVRWGSDPGFVVSVGGFHPRFAPPAGLPHLDRVALTLSQGDNPRVRFESYVAVTSNTLQFGARVELRGRLAGFGVDGGAAFDALISWRPFGLEVAFQAWVALTGPAGPLLAVALDLHVRGPQPWHVFGRAQVRVLFLSADVAVQLTVGEPPAQAQMEPVDVAALLSAELQKRAAWQTTPPAGTTPGVITRIRAGDGALVVDPLAEVTVRQRVVPLGIEVTRVGARLPRGGPRSYELESESIAGVRVDAAHDLFALGQFIDLEDDERLRSPSFVRLPSGATVSAVVGTGLPHDRALTTDLVPEIYVVDDLDTPAGPRRRRSHESGHEATRAAPADLSWALSVDPWSDFSGGVTRRPKASV